MSLQSLTFRSAVVLGFATLALVAVSWFSQTAYAAETPTLTLTVETLDGQAATSIANGEEIVLRWFIDGAVTDCSINNGIGAIDTSVLPVNGSVKTTPLPDTDTSYTLTCSGIAATATVNTNRPTVTMGVLPSTNLSIDPARGYVESLDVTWESQNADECGLMWREKESAPGVKITETDGRKYWYQYFTSGSVRFDGNPRSVSETTTFYVTCTNNNVSPPEEVTGAVMVTVANPIAPEDPTVDIVSTTRTVVQDELYGYATAQVSYRSSDATTCERSAYYDNGVKYPNPSGWDGTPKLSFDSSSILLATTTVFEVKCSRGAVTVSGVVYPAASVTKTIRIEVLPPAGVISANDWDRTTLPAVVATIIASPNPALKDPTTEKAPVSVNVHSENADYCKLKAYGIGSSTAEYLLSGWTNPSIPGHADWSASVQLEKDTRLEVNCVRDYDQAFGNAAEKENGREIASVEVVVSNAYLAQAAPVAYLYANAVAMDADAVWNSSVKVGWNQMSNGTPKYIENQSFGATSNSISFPFAHPFGQDDNYDIHFRYCDENDGVSTFRFLINGVQVGSNLVSDRTDSPGSECNWSTTYTDLIASDINISDGDVITIECDTPQDGEYCRFSDIYFGAGEGGSVETTVVNSLSPTVDVSLLWLSSNATQCGSYEATDLDGGDYSWTSGSISYGTKIVSISTTTTFNITCSRPSDGASDNSRVKAKVLDDATLVADVVIASGECKDPDTLEYIPKSPASAWGPDPANNGICMEVVDLAASSSAISIPSDTDEASASDGVDNINGVYGNIDALILIKNLGPVVLEDGNPITYQATLDIDSNDTVDMSSTVASDSGFLAVLGESEVLTRTFNDVPFGDHKVCAEVNLDGSPNFPENSAKLENNTDCGNVNLPVPHPPMSITVNKTAVRQGQSTTIDWNVDVSYELNCVVKGAGGLNESFEASANPNGTSPVGPLTSTSEYILKCTEPTTQESFFETVRVEVIPIFQEN